MVCQRVVCLGAVSYESRPLILPLRKDCLRFEVKVSESAAEQAHAEVASLAGAHVLALQAVQRGLLLLAQRQRLRHPPAPLLLHSSHGSFLCRCT